MPLCRTRDASLSYLWLGATAASDRDPVVLVHGLGASLAFWFPVIAPALARTRRVLLFDLRGHGRSQLTRTGYTPLGLAADLAELFETLGLTRAHVVGHSFGASVGLAFALQHPGHVASLTIADARIRALQPNPAAANRSPDQPRSDALGRIAADAEFQGAVGIELLTKIAHARLRQPGITRPATLQAPSPFGGLRGKAAALRWLELVRTTTLASDVASPETATIAEVAQCAFPIMLIYGQYSPAMRSAIAFKELCSKARLETVAGTGHFFPLTQPEALLTPLQQFLDGSEQDTTLGREDYEVVSDA